MKTKTPKNENKDPLKRKRRPPNMKGKTPKNENEDPWIWKERPYLACRAGILGILDASAESAILDK